MPAQVTVFDTEANMYAVRGVARMPCSRSAQPAAEENTIRPPRTTATATLGVCASTILFRMNRCNDAAEARRRNVNGAIAPTPPTVAARTRSSRREMGREGSLTRPTLPGGLGARGQTASTLPAAPLGPAKDPAGRGRPDVAHGLGGS